MLSIKAQKYNSVLVSASSDHELCRTFMRFQEHYESPNINFRGQIFTVGEYLAWYSKQNGGATYYDDWRGFNFPSYILRPFKEGLFDPLTKEEQKLLKLLKYRNDDYYIIGGNNEGVIRHELAHALYRYKSDYAKEITRVFDKNKTGLKKAAKYILDKGYTREVLYDELQAYITDNEDAFIINNTPPNIISSVNQLYQKYST